MNLLSSAESAVIKAGLASQNIVLKFISPLYLFCSGPWTSHILPLFGPFVILLSKRFFPHKIWCSNLLRATYLLEFNVVYYLVI